MLGVDDARFIFQLNKHAASFSESIPEESSKATGHIIDPLTHLPIENKRITFAQRHCPMLAEVLSTTLIIAPTEDAATILSNRNPIKAYIFNKIDNNAFQSSIPMENKGKTRREFIKDLSLTG